VAYEVHVPQPIIETVETPWPPATSLCGIVQGSSKFRTSSERTRVDEVHPVFSISSTCIWSLSSHFIVVEDGLTDRIFS